MKESTVKSRNIKSASVHSRYIPTFTHQKIFGDLEENNSGLVRNTPTFKSTAFNSEGYQIKTQHSRKQQENKKENKKQNREIKISSYKNVSKQRKLMEMNPLISLNENCSHLRDSNLINNKEGLLNNANLMGKNQSRVRKYVEQMSNPIFGGNSWEPIVKKKKIEVADKIEEKPKQQVIVEPIVEPCMPSPKKQDIQIKPIEKKKKVSVKTSSKTAIPKKNLKKKR